MTEYYCLLTEDKKYENFSANLMALKFCSRVAGPLRDIVKIIPDWSNEAQLDAHLWRPTSKSDSVCFKSGDKCSVCETPEISPF